MCLFCMCWRKQNALVHEWHLRPVAVEDHVHRWHGLEKTFKVQVTFLLQTDVFCVKPLNCCGFIYFWLLFSVVFRLDFSSRSDKKSTAPFCFSFVRQSQRKMRTHSWCWRPNSAIFSCLRHIIFCKFTVTSVIFSVYYIQQTNSEMQQDSLDHCIFTACVCFYWRVWMCICVRWLLHGGGGAVRGKMLSG